MHDDPGTNDRVMARRPEMHFAILGHLEVTAGGAVVDPGPLKQRLLLALLLSRANRGVTIEALTEALWNDRPPRTARKNLQVYVAALRKIIGDRIVHNGFGYTLRVSEHELDLLRFEAYAVAGQRLLRQGDRAGAARRLDSAIRCWRGPALAEFVESPVAVRESQHLDARFIAAYEDWAELKAGLGQYADVLSGIDDHMGRHPFRERLSFARMTALAGCGRTAEALAHYDDVRQRMARELGIQPSPVLTALYRRILTDDGEERHRSDLPRAVAVRLGPDVSGLPRDLPDFVGRSGELKQLTDHLALGSPVDVAVVTGPAGIGKTTIAVRAARHLAAGFPDGVSFVPLRGPTGQPREAVDVMADVLRQAGYGDVGVAHIGSLWRSWLGERRMLLVMDEAADEETVRALLPGPGRNRIIITSRSRLSGLDAVSRVDVGELAMIEALELLSHLIGAERMAAERPAAEHLVELCGREPLAIRIAGTRLATLRCLSIRRYADRIADDRTLFDELIAGDLSVHTRFDGWFRSVPEDCLRGLGRLAPLPEPVLSRENVLSVLAGVGMHAEHVLGQLVELNLVSVPDVEVLAHHEVYGITALLRRYIRSRLGTGPTPRVGRIVTTPMPPQQMSKA